ncbi:MAG TPA: hypothetical protein DEA08_05215 [Planctomycetes bacterium]|nr:hypothetical protein [Planctomycetota bacterium]
MSRRSLHLAEVVLLIFIGTILVTLLLPSFHYHGHYKANKTKCMSNQRQLALAAIQYSDDKRYFPHVGPLRQLSGDASSNHAPKVVRSLYWYGYHDNPEGAICPSSIDVYVPIQNKAVRDDLRLWNWSTSKEPGDKERSPLEHGFDPSLLQTEELSYGWTRKGMNSNVRSTAVLLADRGVRTTDQPARSVAPGDIGNHSEGWAVTRADASSEFIPTTADPSGEGTPAGEWLRGTGKRQGFLAISWRADR